MAAIVVIGILSSSAAYLILDSVDDYMDATLHAQLQDELSLALDRIVREIRWIELDPEIAGPITHITGYTASSLTWDDGPTGSAVTHSVTMAGGELLLQADGFTGPILTDATSLIIRAYDENNLYLSPPLTLAACAPIRRIEFTLGVTRSGVTDALRSKVYLRAAMAGSG